MRPTIIRTIIAASYLKSLLALVTVRLEGESNAIQVHVTYPQTRSPCRGEAGVRTLYLVRRDIGAIFDPGGEHIRNVSEQSGYKLP
jgi:hypothetical protein